VGTKNFVSSTSIILVIAAAIGIYMPLHAQDTQASNDSSAGTTLRGEVNVRSQRLPRDQSSNLKTETPQQTALPPPAPQFLPGNASTDTLSGSTSADTLSGSASTNTSPGNTFTNLLPGKASANTFSLDITQFGTSAQQQNLPLNAVLTQNGLHLLASYNIELIIDRSMSMRQRDCPGSLSRWNWVGQQSEELAAALTPYTPDGLTITTFAWNYNVYRHSSPQAVIDIFNRTNLELGTRLGEPLEDRLTDYFRHYQPDSKPLLIVIITDGVPIPRYEPDLVRNELVNATEQMTNPKEVTIAFLQVGSNDAFGTNYLTDLDVNLVNHGARYDIVHTKLFNTLEQIGVAQALVQAVEESRSSTKPKLTPVPVNYGFYPHLPRRWQF
jgi:hypothetical protein